MRSAAAARSEPRDAARPDGIEPRHVEAPRGWRDHTSALSLVVLAAIVGAGAIGLAGSPTIERSAESPAVRLTVSSPDVIRNGEVYEAHLQIEARQPIGKLALGVSPALWRDTTVNSMVPAPSDETHAGGLFRFTYGPLARGERFEIKISLQINPTLSGHNEGRVVVYDGDRELLAMQRSVRILP